MQLRSTADWASPAEEQAALRRVATLVAEGNPPNDVFDAVAVEVGRLTGADMAVLQRYDQGGGVTIHATHPDGTTRELPFTTRPTIDPQSVTGAVLRTGRPARIDDYARVSSPSAAQALELGYLSAVGAPVTVQGRLWGALSVISTVAFAWPPDTEDRLAEFAELVAASIANAESRGELAASEARARELAEEQAALRRVATVVARAPASERVFSTVAREVASVLNVPGVIVQRYETDGAVVTFGEAFDSDLAGAERFFAVGSRMPRDPGSLAAQVFDTQRAARVDDFSTLPGTIGDLARAAGLGSGCAGPIVVDGDLWGKLCVFSRAGTTLPAGTENRLHDFIELVATAIANYEAHARLRTLADEQAALRRVATLVAEGATPNRVFDAVRGEVARMFDLPNTILMRYDADGMATMVATHADSIRPVGSRWRLDKHDTSSVGRVFWTGRAARTPDLTAEARGPISEAARKEGARYGVGVPVVVDGALWGAVSVASPGPAPPPADLELRLAEFTDLLAIAIANAESHAELSASEARARELASEQAALRRVATLVAQGASPDELFSAVAKEVAGIIGIPVVGVHRYDPDGAVTTLGIAGETGLTVGTRLRVTDQGMAAMILSNGGPSRRDDYTGVPRDAVREDMRLPMVGVPIVVEGGIWGFMVAVAAEADRPIPAGTEERLARFTELVATAVSNASTRTELLTSRARLVSAADETRRRLERDLHDGIQQWLVALALRARRASGLAAADESVVQELSGLADDLVAVTDELREISRGIHPAILSDAGLDDALGALARRSAIRVDLDVSFNGRYDPTLEATVYYVAAESITNAVKHAQASTVTVRGGRRDGTVELEIRDDGVGGADPRLGTGLIGLKDRVDTLGGTISFASPAGAGTAVRMMLPAGARDRDPPVPRPDEAASPASG